MAELNVFITGGTGYVGQNVVSELFKRGIVVTVLARRPVELPGCRTVVGDLANIEPFVGEIAAAGAVIHLASSRSYDADMVMSEIVATGLLIQAWRNGSFISASSGTVGGWGPEPLLENSPARLSNGYVMGKLCNEFQLRVAQPLYQRGSAISLRPAGLFISTNDRRHTRQRFSILYQRCQQNCRFVFQSEEGLATYGSSFVGGADFGRAAADSLAIKVSGSYNVASGFCTWKSLIETINRTTGTRADFAIQPSGFVGPGEFLLPQSRTCLDVSAFGAQVGFVPQQGLEELVHDFVQAERVSTTSKPGMKTVS
jgi:nucleoside-diphosphate-sugar epimerase